MNLVKEDPSQPYWPRLTKEKIKNQHIQADWSKWVDEDEESEAKPLNEEWDQDNMNSFGGGAGGFGGDQGDSDDEEEEEEEHEHVHSEHCSHGTGAAAEGEHKNADLGDLDKEEDAVAQWALAK